MRDDSTSRLRVEELRVTREHLTNKSQELQHCLAELREKDLLMLKLQE
jgi:hypothetical protein